MSNDFGSDALPDLALSLRINGQDKIGMSLDVDEAWRHREAIGIYDLLCIARTCDAERCDPAAGDRNIANDTWPATSVDDEPTSNQEIPAHTHSSRLGCGERTLYALA
jgi:hypothetical protein